MAPSPILPRTRAAPASSIPPNREQRVGLDYLGLGDWHDQRQIGPATWYSGTPETDGFKHETAPAALVVRIAARGTPAQATTVGFELEILADHVLGEVLKGARVFADETSLPALAPRHRSHEESPALGLCAR